MNIQIYNGEERKYEKILTSLAPQMIGVPLLPAPVTLKVSTLKTTLYNKYVVLNCEMHILFLTVECMQ